MASDKKRVDYEKSIGEKFNLLTVEEFFRKEGHHEIRVRCKCECGTITEGAWSAVRLGKKKSCGCIKRASENHWNRKHGLSHRKRHTKVYRAYRHILSRCYNENVPSFKNYGARGIVMCVGWKSDGGVVKFHKAIGEPPTGDHQADRIDNDGHYSCGECEQCKANGWPMNVEWATRVIQCNHRRSTKWVTLDGIKMSAADAARKTGIPHATLIARLGVLGWDEQKSLTEPVRNRKT